MTTWIIATDPHIEALLAQARTLADEIVLIDVGCGPGTGVDQIITIPTGDHPAEALTPAVVAAVQAQPGDVILVRNGPAERVLAGALAAALNASVLTDVRALSATATTQGRYGGIPLQTVESTQIRLVLADGGAVAETSGEAESGPTIDPQPMVITASQRDETTTADLTSAKRIIGVGMGFRDAADMALAQQLAAVIKAELACSRPIAEGAQMLGGIGVPGLRPNKVTPSFGSRMPAT